MQNLLLSISTSRATAGPTTGLLVFWSGSTLLAKSRTIDGDHLLVALPLHETRKIICPLREDQRKILRDADQTIMDQARAEHLERCKTARSKGQLEPKATCGSYSSKAHKLRAATVIPNILAFCKQHQLKLTDAEMRNYKDRHGQGVQRPEYPELAGKEMNWLTKSEDSLYNVYLDGLTRDAPKLVALKDLIDSLEDFYGRPEIASNLHKFPSIQSHCWFGIISSLALLIPYNADGLAVAPARML